MEKGFNFMASLIPILMESEKWADISLHDPEICAAEKEASEILKKLKSIHPEDTKLLFALDTAMGSVATAYMAAAILYGMSIAMDIRDATANPTACLQSIAAGSGVA